MPSDHEDSESNTISDIPEPVQHDTDETAETSHPIVSEPITTNLEVTFLIPNSIPITDDFFQDFTLPSPTSTISTPITIAPFPLISMGVRNLKLLLNNLLICLHNRQQPQQILCIHLQFLLIYLIWGQVLQVLLFCYDSHPISPLHQDDPDTIFGDDPDEFTHIHYIPFYVQAESEDEASFTKGLSDILQTNKVALEKVRIDIQAAHMEHQTSISSKIDKLHEDLCLENKIMDKHTIKTEKVKVLSFKITHVNNRIDEILSKKFVMKSYIGDMNSILSNIIETRDYLITITVRKHLAAKIRHVFSMLNMLEGVLKSDILPKQGGEQGKSFGVEKSSGDNDDDEEEEEKSLKIKRKIHDVELDNNFCIAREAKEREKAALEAQVTLES
ncbi:unnamed protein product [Lactuca saligna]|uniref:Uncharacterized protein n=1 Tax=Lactuca saligna TaxID=75948 RepID=A0AA35Z940_LACSI|nr:unnamed protein product [Lactuca saligna]